MTTGAITRNGTTVPERQVIRYSFPERATHWINATSYTYLLLTGLALFTPYLYWLATMLGGGGTIRFWHPWIGLIYVATIFWMQAKWRRDMATIPADQGWKKNVKYYIQNRDEMVPPQGRFNAGQKQFWWVMFWCTFILLATGIVMWFPEKVPANLHWVLTASVFVHSLTALITIAAFIIHVYMSIWMTPGSMKAMMEGHVSERWATAHHRLWYEKITGRRNAP
jgi:formate dehydrogenase subunit gamma